ncbi:hypothetical protein SAMN04515647_2865 [Cohaesibacter sp. ES.047]|nr:hypothetical protein SAMN04515647_2865 [Cohaesibacter sp. ES.047]
MHKLEVLLTISKASNARKEVLIFCKLFNTSKLSFFLQLNGFNGVEDTTRFPFC